MPIRLCQKCGLKVLIDESQAATSPFYCQRCTTAMKGQGGGDAGPAASEGARPAASAAGRPATVRVLCPYCKASFNGRVPQKPARGACPVCQKELILLPNGEIKPAAGFDPSQPQPAAAAPSSEGGDAPEPTPSPAGRSGGAAVKESGTRMLVKKYAAEPPAPAEDPQIDEPVTAPADTASADEAPSELPGWLDDASKSQPLQAPADTDTAVEDVPAQEPVEESAPEPAAVRLEDLPDISESPRSSRPATSVRNRPPAAVVPPPPPPPPAPAKSAPAAAAARKGGTKVTERRTAPRPVPGALEPTGAGLFLLALLLLVIPVGAVPFLLNKRDMFKEGIAAKLGDRLTKGLKELHHRLLPPPEAPKPKVEEKAPAPPPPEERAQPTEEDRKRDEADLTKRFEKIRRLERDVKSNAVGATPEQQAALQQIQIELDNDKKAYAERQALYKKIYGKDYDPEKQ